MYQYPIASKDALHQISQTLINRFHPNRVVLYGSRARGDARPGSDYDLMVEISTDRDRWLLRNEMQDVLWTAHREIAVDLIVRTPDEFDRFRHDVGLVDYDIAREGIVLYSATNLYGWPKAAPARVVRERPTIPPASVVDWLAHAEQDLTVMDVLLDHELVPWSAVCFHAQQAAEKFLKVLLIQRHVRPDRTHSLTHLLIGARAIGYALPGLDVACQSLEAHAVDSRYPGSRPIPSEGSGERAVDDLEHIMDLVAPLVGRTPWRRPARSKSQVIAGHDRQAFG